MNLRAHAHTPLHCGSLVVTEEGFGSPHHYHQRTIIKEEERRRRERAFKNQDGGVQ